MIVRGCIYWARLPGDPKLRRPVLVVSHDIRNERASSVVVIPLSTVKRLGPWHVPIGRGEGGLPRASVLKCEDVTTLPKHWLEDGALGGPLSRAKLALVREAVLSALDFDHQG